MTRAEAKQNLINLGITEPTDEQIGNYLNTIHAVATNEKSKNENLQREADRAKDLESTLADLNKKLETLEADRLATLEREKKANLKAKFAEIGIVGEVADKFVDGIVSGEFDVDALGKTITERENAAAEKKEKEIADGSLNAGGGSSEQTQTKTESEELVNKIVGSMSKSNSDDILKNYM